MLRAQEAPSGFELRATISEQASYSHQLEAAPRNGSPLEAAFRAVFYPTWKLSEHWTASAAVQTASTPYFYDQFVTRGYRVHTNILRADVSYSRGSKGKSVVVRLGELSSAFGSFLLRYDDARNALIDVPAAYGYYYKPVSNLGVAGAQADVTLGKLDARAQFANSSPANPRSLLDRGQFRNWAGGAGYTIRQGFRVGGSAYRGPYLDPSYRFYFPGEAPPRSLPATAAGIDVEWGRGPWNVYGEWQRFQMDYHLLRTYHQDNGYAEARRVLSPRWYVAARAGYMRSSAAPALQIYEFAAGYRPNRLQLAKLGYEIQQGPAIRGTLGNTL